MSETLVGCLFMALGLFTGNFLYHGIVHKDWRHGFMVGSLTVVLFVPSYLICMYFLNK